MQMHPAPMPPMGIATWVALSPLKVRWGPLSKSSAGENGAASFSGVAASAGTVSAGVAAAAIAAEEVAFRKSRRVGFFDEGMRAPVEEPARVSLPIRFHPDSLVLSGGITGHLQVAAPPARRSSLFAPKCRSLPPSSSGRCRQAVPGSQAGVAMSISNPNFGIATCQRIG